MTIDMDLYHLTEMVFVKFLICEVTLLFLFSWKDSTSSPGQECSFLSAHGSAWIVFHLRFLLIQYSIH